MKAAIVNCVGIGGEGEAPSELSHVKLQLGRSLALPCVPIRTGQNLLVGQFKDRFNFHH